MFNFNKEGQGAEKPTPKFQRFNAAGAPDESGKPGPFQDGEMMNPNKGHEIHYAACNISSDSGGDKSNKRGSFASRERGTFLVMEPRDESLMRKAKVREILKTF